MYIYRNEVSLFCYHNHYQLVLLLDREHQMFDYDNNLIPPSQFATVHFC